MRDLTSAYTKARAEIEGLYEDTCTVTEYQSAVDDNYITRHTEAMVYADQPCRLSFSALSAANQTEAQADLAQGVKLFIAPELDIKPGSKITVTRSLTGTVTDYKNSGKSAVYVTHQEIPLVLFDRWA